MVSKTTTSRGKKPDTTKSTFLGDEGFFESANTHIQQGIELLHKARTQFALAYELAAPTNREPEYGVMMRVVEGHIKVYECTAMLNKLFGETQIDQDTARPFNP